jgi:hypothetical protein
MHLDYISLICMYILVLIYSFIFNSGVYETLDT